MSKKIGQDVFIFRAKEKHGGKYDYKDTVFTTFAEEVTIRCKKHGYFTQNSWSHLTGCGCKKCGIESRSLKRRGSKEDFIAKSEILYPYLYDYSRVVYKNIDTPVEVKCKKHGYFEVSPYNHLYSNRGCSKCSGHGLTKEDFVKEAKLVHGNCYDYSKTDFTLKKNLIQVVCKKHGAFTLTAGTHLGGVGCKDCSALRSSILRSKVLTFTTKKFIEKAKLIYGEEYLYDKTVYTGMVNNIEVVCRKHGLFKRIASTHLKGSGCKTCYFDSRSKPAISWIEQYAKSKRLKNVQHAENGGEYTIPGTRFKVDGFHARSNTVFEFHGDVFHGNPLVFKDRENCHPFRKSVTAKQLYQETIKREEVIESLGYKVVVIWESDYKVGLKVSYILHNSKIQ
jgi:peroxiredoxin